MHSYFHKVFLDNTIQDWLIALGILAGTFLIVAVAGRALMRKLHKIAQRTESQYDDIVLLAVEKFIFPFLYIGGFYLALSYLTLTPRLNKGIHFTLLLLYTYFVLRIITAIMQYMVTSFLRRQEGGDQKQKQARGLLTVVKFFVWAIGFVFALDNLGINVSTIIAGLGVGGIAIALAAQAVLGDLFSYFIIFFDRPFEIGDFIVFDKEMGTVEYIGVKSTRLRTLNGQLLVCSNKDLTNARVNNFRNMQKRRVLFKIGVVYDTPADKLEKIPGMVKQIITKDERLQFDRGHFTSFGDSSLDFEFVYYVPSPDYNQYMDIQQRINFDIFRQFETEGIEFAYPTQTLLMKSIDKTAANPGSAAASGN